MARSPDFTELLARKLVQINRHSPFGDSWHWQGPALWQIARKPWQSPPADSAQAATAMGMGPAHRDGASVTSHCILPGHCQWH